ncbi:uncharacterized protein LOC118156317 [Oxyura jamaicensis]|uniref:uncharacterized protein LOC118156317 n=1 Tax=Oxyura jamaicensis TaxID=8884 RepID=UPI0015A72775|nr:uncharacterized protein LOC118156317 [Oxyura jamaicensis]
MLPFLRCWWRGRAHGGPRSGWGLRGGSVGKWFWFNGPLARPGDSSLYVILSFITYTCDQRLPLPQRSFSRFPFDAEPGRAAHTGGIPVPGARRVCPLRAAPSRREKQPRRSGFDPRREKRRRLKGLGAAQPGAGNRQQNPERHRGHCAAAQERGLTGAAPREPRRGPGGREAAESQESRAGVGRSQDLLLLFNAGSRQFQKLYR